MLELFLTFFKIGMFTIGGGYVMIPLVKEYCIEKKGWITEEEFLDVLAIAESTPGPIAINMATYVGYKKYGIKGSIVSTIAVNIPSFIVIYIVALIFDDLLKIKIINDAFTGIRIGVSVVIIDVAYGMLKSECKNSKDLLITNIVFFISLFVILFSSFFMKGISTIEIIVCAIILGIILMKVKKV